MASPLSQIVTERKPGPRIIWAPNSVPQELLLECPVFEVFFGGARGGGKTDGVLGEWAQHASRFQAAAIGLMVRRTSTQLGEVIHRAREIFVPLGARFLTKPDVAIMPGGARLNFRFLERDQDAENYQGHSYTRLYIEEAGNFPNPAPIFKLFATLRSGKGVPCRVRLTGNPGGPGHHWLKSRYIDPAPLGLDIITDPETGRERVYIPSRVRDNVHLGADYIANLKMSGSPELVKAWLEGDWDVIAGAFFPEWDASKHVILPRSLPRYWHRFRSFDWGSAHPFSVGWWAVSDGELDEFPRGALIRYREWYGSDGRPNVGLRMTAEEVARGILEREADDLPKGDVMSGVADPALFTADGGPSLADRMATLGVFFNRADNKRTPKMGALGGWDQLRSRLKGEDGVPAIYIFSTCTELIRTLPMLQHDPDQMEDVDTHQEDHAPDEARYACMSRPYVIGVPEELLIRDRYIKRRGPARAQSWMSV